MPVMHKAKFCKQLKGKTVQCNLCARHCAVSDKAVGSCGVRKNFAGTLRSLVYGKLISAAMDPIEKKPLYHFFPGTKILSIASVGCNLHCKFCQNWDISQPEKIFGHDYSPKDIVSLALKHKAQSIAYTYTEPTVFYEFAHDTAKLAHKKGLKNVFVTNGYIEKEPLEEISPYLDAANIDIKGFSDAFYKNHCDVSKLKPVLDTIKRMKKLGIHVEVTNLLVHGHNTSDAMIRKLCEWVAKTSPDIPLHFSRCFPAYHLQDIEPTPERVLEGAVDIAKKAGVRHVYLGNVLSFEHANTYCHECETLLIARSGYVTESRLREPKCPRCGAKINVVLK